MKTRPWITTLVISCALGGPLACDTEAHSTDVAERVIVFDADEVHDVIARDADAVFFVDLREPATYVFEQPEEPIDRTRFVVLLEGMDYARPLSRVLEEAQVDAALDGPSWSLRTSDEVFRGPLHQSVDDGEVDEHCTFMCIEGHCTYVCPF